jgi:hypothetical protein
MAVFGVIRRISREDLAKKGELPAWVDEMLSTLNEFLDRTVTALRGGLTYDNFACKSVQLKFTSGTARTVSLAPNQRVSGIHVLEALNHTVTGYGFYRNSDGTIDVRIKFEKHDGTAASGEVMCTVKVLLG